MADGKDHKVIRMLGGWGVYKGAHLVSGPCTNAEAWRLADRLNSEPISRAEDVSEWMSRKD